MPDNENDAKTGLSVFVDHDICSGCGTCTGVCPEVFRLNDEGIAEVMPASVIEKNYDSIQEAAKNCPSGAIVIEDNETGKNHP